MRKTKIICTLGPAIDDDNLLKEMMLNGLDCARLNFSHGTHEEQLARINRVKRIREELNLPIPILLDTKGPEIRIRQFEEGKIELNKDQLFTLKVGTDLGNNDWVCITYPNLYKNISVDTRILIDDGNIALDVVEIKETDIVCKVVNGGVLSNNKSINIPNVSIDMPYISEVDKSDIIFGIENDVDFIAASFVRTPNDIIELRRLLKENDGQHIQIIAKIENTSGIENLDAIIELSDGIMIARGDMGVELPFKDLPIIQKDIIKKCYREGKHVITATQMLESMTKSPRPTRAEVSDVANAIYDGSTAIMLSGESAAGKYPIESVKTMADIAETTEKVIKYESRFKKNKLNIDKDIINAIATAVCEASYCLNAKAIIAMTKSGRTARIVSNYRPACPVIAATVSERACRQLNLAWNVMPIKTEEKYTTDELLKYGIQVAKESGVVHNDDIIVITGTSIIGAKDTDLMTIHRI